MAIELPSLGARRVIASLPEFDVDDLLPACEMLCQEGFSAWALPWERRDEIAPLTAAFGRRARIGISGVTTAAQVSAAVEAGAAFAASDFQLPRLVKAVSGFPVILGGFTPTELRAGIEAGAAAVQLTPADAFDADYARALPRLLGYAPLIVSGALRRGLAAAWLESGAVGVWPESLANDALVVASSLDGLRGELVLWRLDD